MMLEKPGRILVIKNFEINPYDKITFEKIKKIISEMYSADYRKRLRPLSRLIGTLKHTYDKRYMRDLSYLYYCITINDFSKIISFFNYEIDEIKKIYCKGTYITTISDIQNICTNCDGWGNVPLLGKNNSFYFRKCKLCNGIGKVDWIDKVKNRG